MREIDATGRKLCEIQARIFEESLSHSPLSSPIFIRRFLYSEVAERFDDASFLLLSLSDEDVFAEIASQYGPLTYGKVHFNANQLHWMGYLYRYWAYTQETPSRYLLSLCNSRELASYFEPLHTQDPGAALDTIMEAKGLRVEDLKKRTLELLAEQRQKN